MFFEHAKTTLKEHIESMRYLSNEDRDKAERLSNCIEQERERLIRENPNGSLKMPLMQDEEGNTYSSGIWEEFLLSIESMPNIIAAFYQVDKPSFTQAADILQFVYFALSPSNKAAIFWKWKWCNALNKEVDILLAKENHKLINSKYRNVKRKSKEKAVNAAKQKWLDDEKTKAMCKAYQLWKTHPKEGRYKAVLARHMLEKEEGIAGILDSEKGLSGKFTKWERGKEVPVC